MARVARFLGDGTEGPLAQCTTEWESTLPHLASAIAFVVTRAAYADVREPLLALLRAYLDTPFAGGMTLRRATLDAPDGAPILRGKVRATSYTSDSQSTWLYSEGTSRYFVRRESPMSSALTVLEAFATEPQLPAGVTLVTDAIVETPDERARLLAILGRLDSDGPVPLRASDAEALAALSGRSLPEAKLLVAGLPKVSDYSADFLGKPLREAMEIKVQEAKLARTALAEENRLAILAAAVTGAEAGDVFAESTADAPAPWVAAMARGFESDGEGKHALRPELVEEVRKIVGWRAKPAEILLPLVAPSPQAPTPAATSEHGEHAPEGFDDGFFSAIAEVWPHLVLTLPGGDEYVRGMPAAVERLRGVLAGPATLLHAATVYFDTAAKRDSALESIAGTDVKMRVDDADVEGRDNGAAVALRDGSHVLVLLLRPSALLRKDRAAEVSALSALLVLSSYGDEIVRTLRFLQSDTLTRMMLRVSSAAPGAFDADPRIGAPASVAKAVTALGLSEPAATLYLQLLALPAPTDKLVTTVNRWSAGELSAAKRELLELSLVIEGKRERAGRDVFLPGGWEARSGGAAAAVETWKLPFYGGRASSTVMEPIGELYVRALERALGDDRPRFEEVAEVRKKKGKKR
jgi:hypothetical protein